jgi:hypothetical protein
LIGNIEKVQNDCKGINNNQNNNIIVHRRTQSLTSSSQRSNKKKRGASLERLIRRTITMTTYMEGLESGRTARSSSGSSAGHNSSSRSVSSTEDILRDLNEADAVLTSEIASIFSNNNNNLLPPVPIYLLDHDHEPNLLPPPVISSVKAGDVTSWDWNPSWHMEHHRLDKKKTDHGRLATIESQPSTDETNPATVLSEDDVVDPFGAWPAFDDTGGPFSAVAASPFYEEVVVTTAADEQGFPSSSSLCVFGNFDESSLSSQYGAEWLDPNMISDFSSSPNPFVDNSSSCCTNNNNDNSMTSNSSSSNNKHSSRFIDNPSPSGVAEVGNWF